MAEIAKEIDRDKLLDIYTRTMKVNRTDEKFRELLMQGKVAVMYYCVRGQELVSAAAMAALEDDDYVVCTYRGQGEQTAKGIPIEKWWGECLGKATGTCKGKGGTMHITDPDTGIMVTTGVVGSGLPIANGLAMASQNSGDGRVTLVSFGDGAANIGGFHEAMNMAQLYKLPVVFLCQNNRYGEHTAYADHTDTDQMANRAAGYGMKGVTVDGNDVNQVYPAVKEAVDRARAGEGPGFLEAVTYRWRGHVGHREDIDVGVRRSTDEIAAWKTRDPIQRLVDALTDRNEFDADAFAKLNSEVQDEVDDAVTMARQADYPPVKALLDMVYAHAAGER